MKNFIRIISFMLSSVFILTGAVSALSDTAKTEKSKENTLNVSAVSEEQVKLCTAVMIDGFEADETVRTASGKTEYKITDNAFEGDKCASLTGTGQAGISLALQKKKSTANARSLCVCAYVTPADGAEFVISVTVKCTEKTLYGESCLPAGMWCAAYLPIDTAETVNIENVKIIIKSNSPDAAVSCLVDRVHTAVVDGMPEKLRYFASDYIAANGEIEYTDDALVFKPYGLNGSIESTVCGYMTNGLYNALAVTLNNGCDGDNITLSLKLDSQLAYKKENTHTLALLPGEHVYYFPIGGFRSGTTVEALRIELPGQVSGRIAIKSISFSSYRFPADYGGTVKAVIKDGKIVINGSFPNYPASAQSVQLYRLAPGYDEERPEEFDAMPYAETSVSSSFEFEIPLTDGDINNAYYKYLVRYKSKSGYETAGYSYVTYRDNTEQNSLQYKGADFTIDITMLSYLKPGTAYIDVDIGGLLDNSGGVSYKGAGFTQYISDAELEKYDRMIQRCTDENVYTVLRLTYSRFASDEEYYFSGDNDALPDIITDKGVSHYLGLLSFLAKRYESKISAVIPCTVLDSEETAKIRRFTSDMAEKYASDVILSAQSVLSAYGISVIAPVSYDGAPLFLGMMQSEFKNRDKVLVYIEADTAEDAADIIEQTQTYGFGVIVSCRAESAADVVRLYYGCKDAAGIRVRGLSETDEKSELYSVIDTTYGVTASNRLAIKDFPSGVGGVYTDIEESEKVYKYLGELDNTDMPQMIYAIYDGVAADNWEAFDCCKSIYKDVLGGSDAAALSFDYENGMFGFAVYTPEIKRSYSTVYFRLYADHLPEGTDSVRVRITAESEKGTAAGYCTLKAETQTVLAMRLNGLITEISGFTVAPVETVQGSTPRICVSGIYTPGIDPDMTASIDETETMPEPETQVFDTKQTGANDNGKNDARLYIISILVIIGMFAVSGAGIAVIKIRDKRKK